MLPERLAFYPGGPPELADADRKRAPLEDEGHPEDQVVDQKGAVICRFTQDARDALVEREAATGEE